MKQQIGRLRDLLDLSQSLQPGQTIRITDLRDGERHATRTRYSAG